MPLFYEQETHIICASVIIILFMIHTLSTTCIVIILNCFSMRSALSIYVAKMAVKNHSTDATIASLEPLSNIQVEKITVGKPDSISSLHIGEGR